MNKPAPTLSIRALTKIHPPAKVALNALSLEVGEGVFGLLGPNGAGKSSLMEILGGNLAAEEGDALLGGVLSATKRPAAWRRELGYMPQSFDFPPHITGREMMQEAALLLGLSAGKLRGRIGELLERVNLHWAADRDCAEYSRGMKQRLGVALAVLHEPTLLLLDEPTAGLDPEERVVFRDLLAEISTGRVVILSTHIVEDVERCCSRLGVLDSGELRFVGAPRELAARADGRVWETPIDDGRMEELIASRRVVSVVNRGGRVWARLVGSESPGPLAKHVEARLEDGYFELLEGGGRLPLDVHAQ